MLKKMPVNSATSTATITSVSSVSSTTVISSSKTTTISSNSGSSPSTAAEEPASKTSTVLSSVSTTHTSSVSATSKTSTVTTSMSFTPTTVVNSASGSGKNGDSTPVSALTESSSKPYVITNLLEVCRDTTPEFRDQACDPPSSLILIILSIMILQNLKWLQFYHLLSLEWLPAVPLFRRSPSRGLKTQKSAGKKNIKALLFVCLAPRGPRFFCLLTNLTRTTDSAKRQRLLVVQKKVGAISLEYLTNSYLSSNSLV